VVDIKSDTLARLAELPRIVGVKDATGDLERPWVEHNLIHRSDFAWLSGNDSTAVSFNVAGGCGCVSVTANCAPALLSKMQKLMAEGKWEEARDIQYTLMPLHKLMFKEPSPAGAKYAASLLGLCTPECRLPHPSALRGDEEGDQVRDGEASPYLTAFMLKGCTVPRRRANADGAFLFRR